MIAGGVRYIWHPSRLDRFRLWNVSDIHWMAKGCAEKEFKRDLKEIADDPYSFWICGGDACDFIGYRDKRFDPDCLAEWVPAKKLGDLGRYGMGMIRDLFMPIKHKCLGLLFGNHERHYQIAMEQESLHAWLCTELGVQNLGYCCLFDIVFARHASVKKPELRTAPPKHGGYTCSTFRVFAHHGAGHAVTPGGKLNRLIQFMKTFEADVYMCGHVHDRVARKEPILGANADCSKIVQRERLGLVSGSYLKTYTQGTTSYGEVAGYAPTSLGAAVAKIHPDTREMSGEV